VGAMRRTDPIYTGNSLYREIGWRSATARSPSCRMAKRSIRQSLGEFARRE